ncbi:Serum paraoxonase/arylesterase 1, partial [Leucoagaricus sp. SymC.cos]
SVIYYRNGKTIKNSILFKSSLPKGYIAGGEFDTDCMDIGSTATPEIASCEDIAFWDLHDVSGKLQERRLVLGCDPNRHNWNTVMGPLRDPNPRAYLWVYTENTKNSKKPDLRKLELKNYPEGHDFHPLGIEIWPSYGGNSSYLYAVNHARARTVIEQFLLDPADLSAATHIRTISHPLFISPNALALTSPDSFYVSNDHLFTRRLPILGKFVPITETLLGLPLSFVAHVTLNPPSSPADTPIIEKHTIEAPFIPFSNGVSLSPGGGEVAVASTTLSELFFYTRDKATNKLTYKATVPVPFCPDNIRYYAPESHDDENSQLIVSGHPHFPSVVAVAAKKPGAVGQSWIVSISKQPNNDSNATSYDTKAPFSANEKIPLSAIPKEYAIETIFQSDGTGFSTSATGLKDSLTGHVYISGLYAPQGAMVCRSSKST